MVLSSDDNFAMGGVKSPQDILDFWFDGQFGNDAVMDDMNFIRSILPLWFGIELTPKGPKPISQDIVVENDKKCCSFKETLNALTRNELEGPEWKTEQGLFAKIILADQLARNIFRGRPQAFSFAHFAHTALWKLVELAAHERYKSLPPFIFMTTVLQHSENLEDHKACQTFFETMNANVKCPLKKMVMTQSADHQEVIERFGRYPHRNILLGRENTPEEAAWLAAVDKLPSWAKSQMPAKENPLENGNDNTASVTSPN